MFCKECVFTRRVVRRAPEVVRVVERVPGRERDPVDRDSPAGAPVGVYHAGAAHPGASGAGQEPGAGGRGRAAEVA